MIPGYTLVGQSLHCVGIHTHSSKRDLISEVVEAADAILSVFEIVVLDESETRTTCEQEYIDEEGCDLTPCRDWSSSR
jgi:hypothetical protein